MIHSHSMVDGGFPEISYTTRLIPLTSLMILLDTLPNKSYGSSAQWAVIKSEVTIARKETTYSYVLPSPMTPTDFTGRNTVNACDVFSYQPFSFNSSIKIASAFLKRLANSNFTSPRILTPSPGPGKGCLYSISFGKLSASPNFLTSSLNNSLNGSSNFNFNDSGSPPTLW